MTNGREGGRILLLLLAPLLAQCCPPADTILPCRCLGSGAELQIWCSYSALSSVMEALKVMAAGLDYPVDELILESNNLPSLPGRSFEGLDISRLMLRDNGLERVTSNWLGSLENSLLELFIIEPRLRTLPHDALDHLRRVEAVTLQGGLMKHIPRFSSLHKLRYIQVHSPVLTELNADDFDDLPSLEQLHIVGSPLLTKLDSYFLKNLHKLSFLNVSNSGLSWLHPKSFTNLPNLRDVVLMSNRISDAGIVGRACRDLNNLQVIRLDNNYIDRVMENSFTDLASLRELYLGGNMISEIHRGAFRNTPSLKVLDLHGNLLRRINAAAFIYPSGTVLEELWLTDNQLFHVNEMRSLLNTLPRLKFLDMSRNLMEDIPFDVLRGHAAVERLHLDDNKIKRIPPKAFTGMAALRELRLRNNSLSDYADGPSWNLPSLKGLDLSQNKFRRLDSRLLTYLPSLRRLDLSENMIETVLPDTFIGTLELETINLSKNFIPAFHALTFSHLPKLFEVDAGWNRLREVIPGLPRDIEYLRLNKNQIFALPPDLDLPSLRLLDLSGNSLQLIQQGSLRSMSRLQWLHINDNALQNIEDGALDGLSKLEVLNVKNNRIREFDNSCLKGLKSLKEIHIQGNFLEAVRTDMLKYCPRVETLHMSNNRLSDIQPGAFMNGKELQVLDLAHNSLTRFPEAVQALPRLRLLDVSDNNIRAISPTAFESLTSLSELRVSNNRLGELEANTFKELKKLEFLDLHRNDLENIARGAFRSLPSLVAVRLSENRLTRLGEETFVDLPELQSAELQSNNLQDVSDGAFVNTPHLALLNMSNNLLLGLDQAGIRELRSLEVLDLSHNKVTWLEGRNFQGMEWLVELKMDNNIICKIEGSPFNSLPRLRVLSLRHNRMTTIAEPAFQTLRNNIAVLDIDGNPLSCSCRMLWLLSWLKDSSSEGPRCADGSLFRETRLSRAECASSRVVEPSVAGCEAEHLQGPVVETSQLSALVSQRNETSAPLPQETEYFYDEYVEYQYEEINGTNGTSLVQLPPPPPTTTEEPLSHIISGDTPTIYARPNQTPRLNLTNPGLGFNDIKKAQTQPTNPQLTFFGIPLPSLSFGNIWKGNAARSAETQGRNKFTRGKVQPVTKTPKTKPEGPNFVTSAEEDVHLETNSIAPSYETPNFPFITSRNTGSSIEAQGDSSPDQEFIPETSSVPPFTSLQPLPTSNGFVPMIRDYPSTQLGSNYLHDGYPKVGKVEAVEPSANPPAYSITETIETDTEAPYEVFPPYLDLPRENVPVEDAAIVGKSKFIAGEIFRNAFEKTTEKTPSTTEWEQPSDVFVNKHNWYFQNYNRTNIQPFVGYNQGNRVRSRTLILISCIAMYMNLV